MISSPDHAALVKKTFKNVFYELSVTLKSPLTNCQSCVMMFLKSHKPLCVFNNGSKRREIFWMIVAAKCSECQTHLQRASVGIKYAAALHLSVCVSLCVFLCV